MDSLEPAPVVLCYQPSITSEELWRQDQLEYATVIAREQGLIRFLGRQDKAGEK